MAYSTMMPPLCLASYQGNLAEVKSIIQTLGAPDQTTLDDFFRRTLGAWPGTKISEKNDSIVCCCPDETQLSG